MKKVKKTLAASRLLISLVLILTVAPFAAAEEPKTELEPVNRIKAARSSGIESLLPADTSMVLLIEDVPAFLRDWPESPLGKTWNDPQVMAFLAPLRKTMKLERWEEIVEGETGRPLSEILDSFEGQAAVALANFGDVLAQMDEGDTTEMEPPMVAIASIGVNAEVFESLFAKALDTSRKDASEDVQVEDVLREFEGETIHTWREISSKGERATNYWAIADGYVVASGSEDLVEGTISRIKRSSKKEGGESLGSDEQFRAMRSRLSSRDALLYVNMQNIVPELLETIVEEIAAEEAKNKEEQAAGGQAPPQPFDVSAAGLFEAMALDAIHGIGVAAELGRETMQVDVGVSYTEERGFLKMLAYQAGPVSLPAFIPDDVVDASVSAFSFTQFWAGLREMLEGMSPQMGGMIDMQLQQLKASTGIDLESSLLGSLGGQVVMASFPRSADRPGEMPLFGPKDALIGLSVKDRQGLELVLEWVKNMAGVGGVRFESQEFLDQTIFVSKPMVAAAAAGGEDGGGEAQSEDAFSYSLTPEYLFISIGSSDPLRSVLSRMKKPGRSLWNRPEVRAALEVFPDDASAISYQDVSATILQLFGGLATAQQMGGSTDDEESELICVPGELPGREVLDKYLGVAVGVVVRDKAGLFSTVRLHTAGK